MIYPQHFLNIASIFWWFVTYFGIYKNLECRFFLFYQDLAHFDFVKTQIVKLLNFPWNKNQQFCIWPHGPLVSCLSTIKLRKQTSIQILFKWKLEGENTRLRFCTLKASNNLRIYFFNCFRWNIARHFPSKKSTVTIVTLIKHAITIQFLRFVKSDSGQFLWWRH